VASRPPGLNRAEFLCCRMKLWYTSSKNHKAALVLPKSVRARVPYLALRRQLYLAQQRAWHFCATACETRLRLVGDPSLAALPAALNLSSPAETRNGTFPLVANVLRFAIDVPELRVAIDFAIVHIIEPSATACALAAVTTNFRTFGKAYPPAIHLAMMAAARGQRVLLVAGIFGLRDRRLLLGGDLVPTDLLLAELQLARALLGLLAEAGLLSGIDSADEHKHDHSSDLRHR